MAVIVTPKFVFLRVPQIDGRELIRFIGRLHPNDTPAKVEKGKIVISVQIFNYYNFFTKIHFGFIFRTWA